MLVIRLQRTGNRNNPTFRLVAAEKRNSAKKNPLEILGHYLPTREPAVFEIKKDRVEYHLKNGARPSDTVARLLAKEGIKGLEKYMERYTKKRKRNAPDEPEEPPAPAAEPAAEEPMPEEKPEAAPAEEAPKEEEKPTEEPKEEEKKEEAPAEEDAPKEEEGDKKESDA